VAGGAKSRVRSSLHRVPRDEPSPVKTGERDIIERQRLGERGDRPDAVASCARPLRMAARAEVARSRRSDAVLAQPVAVVDKVADRCRIFRCKVLVAAIAVAKRPFIAMLVAAEAGGHLRTDRVRVLLRHSLVAANAIPVRRRLMSTMLEAKVLPRESCPFPGVAGPVAAEARASVVRFRMAPPTGRVGWKVERFYLTGCCYPLVTLDAVDPMRCVGAMLERV
jgi:hypothetical protein